MQRSDLEKRAQRESRAIPAPDANAELAVSIKVILFPSRYKASAYSDHITFIYALLISASSILIFRIFQCLFKVLILYGIVLNI